MNKEETDLQVEAYNENYPPTEEPTNEEVFEQQIQSREESEDAADNIDAVPEPLEDQEEDINPDYIKTDPQVVGYHSLEEQEILYDFILSNFDPTTESVLDLGCGRGDFLRYVEEAYQSTLKYHGVDMNKQLIDVAKELSPDNTFTATNWFSLDGNYAADWVVNINSTTILYEPEGEDFDQTQALRNTVTKMMELADVGIVISLLSTVAADAYDESFLTFDPIETLDWALNEYGAQGGNVKIDHSISDAVFILTIYK